MSYLQRRRRDKSRVEFIDLCRQRTELVAREETRPIVPDELVPNSLRLSDAYWWHWTLRVAYLYRIRVVSYLPFE